jgi:hypothetical protein
MLAEAVCAASGPSLTAEDIETVRQWRKGYGLSRSVIVCNTTFKAIPWADTLFGMDGKWWRQYSKEAKESFKGELVTSSQSYKSYGISFSRHLTFGNTGAGAIHLAFKRGARRIYLLGYDCQKTGGKSHHHGDHPQPLHNAVSMVSWPDQFKRLADALRGKCEVINCTRETALKCFPRLTLEEALSKAAQAA